MRVLELGPSPFLSKGGMATVIKGILEDKKLNEEYEIYCHSTFVDGNIVKRLGYSFYALMRFVFILIFKKYDVFHIHVASYGSTFRKMIYVNVLKIFNKKIILHVHGAEYLVFFNNLSEKKKDLVKKMWAKCDVVIALSEEWKKDFDGIFNHPNIQVVHNGIDVEQYSDAVEPIPGSLNNSFLFLGRLGKRKGVYDLINAAKILEDKGLAFKLYLAGDGEIENAQQMIKDLKLDNHIKIVGWINSNQKVEYLKKVSTIVLPSYNEGLPMTILEGMSCGKTIISTNVGAIPEVVINEENGIIINPGDVVSLAESMERVIFDREFVVKCSINNVQKIENIYSRKTMHSKIKTIFDLLGEAV